MIRDLEDESPTRRWDSLTESDVFGERLFEVELVGQKRQVLLRLFVPNFVHNVLQCVDILPDFLRESEAFDTSDTPEQNTQ